jgi:hypothetical protein
MPKIHSVEDLNTVARQIDQNIRYVSTSASNEGKSLDIVASIESARALFNIGQIASWQSPSGGKLRALLVRYLLYIPLPESANYGTAVRSGRLCACVHSSY